MAVKVEWDKMALSRMLKYDETVGADLLARANEIADKNNANASRYLHSPVRNPLYTADRRFLKHTQCATVHSTSRIAAAIGRKHGYPKKYKS